MKPFYYLLILIFSFSCGTTEYKVCEFETKDSELKLYHDILTELIEQHFYNGYLTQISEELERKYPNPTIDFADSTEFREDLILLQNKIFNDTSKFETICYGSALESGPWTYFYSDSRDSSIKAQMDTTRQWRDIKDFLKSFSSSWESVADTIAKPQTKYTSDSFKLCTSKVIQCEHFYESGIGVVSFSKVFMNDDRTKGLMYYEFTCGGKCGMGEIILVQMIDQKWTIMKTMNLWIS